MVVKSSHNDALLLLWSLYTQPFIDLCFIVFLCCPNLGALCTMRTEIGRRVLEEKERVALLLLPGRGLGQHGRLARQELCPSPW